MNVYAKLQQARVKLQGMNLKKTGENKFAGYDYFELGDFLPTINEIFAELGLFSNISFTSELATMTVVNTDKPEEQIVFTSPMAEANLKGCHPIQNMGAVETYQRRYLYTTALEIVEHDALDRTHGKDTSPNEHKGSYTRHNQTPSVNTNKPVETPQQAPTRSDKPSEAQVKYIHTLVGRKRLDDEGYRELLVAMFNVASSTELTGKQAKELITYLQK